MIRYTRPRSSEPNPRGLPHGAPRMPSWDAKTPVEPRRPNPVDRHDLLHGYDKYFLEDAEFFTLNAKTDSMARTRQDLLDDKIDRLEPRSPARHDKFSLLYLDLADPVEPGTLRPDPEPRNQDR